MSGSLDYLKLWGRVEALKAKHRSEVKELRAEIKTLRAQLPCPQGCHLSEDEVEISMPDEL